MIFVVKDIIVIFRKLKTILILISFLNKRYFSHPENSILNFKSSLTLRRHCNSGPRSTKNMCFKSKFLNSEKESNVTLFEINALVPRASNLRDSAVVFHLCVQSNMYM